MIFSVFNDELFKLNCQYIQEQTQLVVKRSKVLIRCKQTPNIFSLLLEAKEYLFNWDSLYQQTFRNEQYYILLEQASKEVKWFRLSEINHFQKKLWIHDSKGYSEWLGIGEAYSKGRLKAVYRIRVESMDALKAFVEHTNRLKPEEIIQILQPNDERLVKPPEPKYSLGKIEKKIEALTAKTKEETHKEILNKDEKLKANIWYTAYEFGFVTAKDFYLLQESNLQEALTLHFAKSLSRVYKKQSNFGLVNHGVSGGVSLYNIVGTLSDKKEEIVSNLTEQVAELNGVVEEFEAITENGPADYLMNKALDAGTEALRSVEISSPGTWLNPFKQMYNKYEKAQKGIVEVKGVVRKAVHKKNELEHYLSILKGKEKISAEEMTQLVELIKNNLDWSDLADLSLDISTLPLSLLIGFGFNKWNKKDTKRLQELNRSLIDRELVIYSLEKGLPLHLVQSNYNKIIQDK